LTAAGLTSLAQENQNILDAARIRTNPKVIPGPVAGVRAGGGCVADYRIFQACIRAKPPFISLGKARSSGVGRGPLRLAPIVQPFSYAHFRAYSNRTSLWIIDRLSATRVSAAGGAKDPKADSA
jgi:hypothetical protein